MDSARGGSHVSVQQVNEEKPLDNGQLGHVPGRKDELDENVPKSVIMEIYPWISQFKKMCRNSLEERSMASLRALMAFYLRNVRPSVNQCRTKPLRAEKLRDTISEALLFFLYYYRDVGETGDRHYYLGVMSDLLAMYIDMELKASKKGKEHSSKISARLSSCLHVYLEHSAEYLLETMLKVHFMTHNYHDILDPVMTIIFRFVDDHPSSSIMYIRYFLVYRLWKKLNKDVAVRNQINVIAMSSLGVLPNDLPEFILESVLPQVPNKAQTLSTKLLLVQKFELEKSCEEFLKFCNKERGSKTPDETCPIGTNATSPEENKDRVDSVTNNNNFSELTSHVAPSVVENTSANESGLACSMKRPSTSKVSIACSSLSVGSRRARKANDIVFIDLTSDTVTEKVIRSKKKTRRKLSWLENVKKFANSKITAKSTTMEDKIDDREDFLDLRFLQISEASTPAKIDQPSPEDVEEREGGENVEASGLIHDIAHTNIQLADESSRDLECHSHETSSRIRVQVDDEETNEKSNVQVAPGHAEIGQAEISCFTTDEQPLDQYSRGIKIDDTAELPLETNEGVDAPKILEKLSLTGDGPNDQRLGDSSASTDEPSIKEENASVRTSEVTNNSAVSSETVIPGEERVTRLPSPCKETRNEPRKMREVEYHENIDGLSLLASVSQRISHLTAANVSPVEMIKVKNYASMANPVAKDAETPKYTEDAWDNGKILDIYPEEAMDKVAYQVEITSTEIDYSNIAEQQSNDLVSFPNEEARCNPQASLENGNTIDKQDDANVILNGETVVLFQKSPNSNLYIINKAVENRDHVSDDVNNLHIGDRLNETVPFPYDIYESVYRGQGCYDIAQYNRELAAKESRRGKIMKPEQSGDTSKSCDPTNAAKSSVHDTSDDKSRIKRKLNAGRSRRRRIKQEYEGCGNNMGNHVKSSYVLQDCPTERTDPSHSIHIPVPHTTPVYAKYPSATELYIPCHKSCNSIACGLAVNPAGTLHSGNTTGANARCSCLNCTYGIMAHCTECIIPNGETRKTPLDANSYYVPIQSANVQKRNGASVEETLAKIYDDQPLLKYEPKENYRAELDNKLPLKKRFKAIMAMSLLDDVPIKYENMQNYPGTPMLSIAALEAQDNANKSNLDLTSKHRNEIGNQSREMIRRDYRKEMLSSPIAPSQPTPPPPNVVASTLQINANRNSWSAKKKRATGQNTNDESGYDKMKKGAGCKGGALAPTKDIVQAEKKSKEPETNGKKTRQTRSSKRNLPKVNYIYTDGDSDWNPSGGVNGNSLNKRKRKRSNR